MVVDISEAVQIQGWMSPQELEWLAQAASRKRAIVEVGCWKGRSTKVLAKHTQGRVYAVDHWEGCANDNGETRNEVAARGSEALFEEFKRNLAPEIGADRVIPLRCESGKAPPMLEELIGVSKVDFLFIDADHDYHSVKRDILNFRPLLRGGGLLSGHDYSDDWPGVKKAVDELVPDRLIHPGTAIWYLGS